MENPYLDTKRYAEHIIHMNKLIKNVERYSPSLAQEIRRGIIKLEHHNNALNSQLESMECIR